jgi:Ca2+-binding RTX toxin-like protein
VLLGQNGHDTLTGADGNDTMRGGAGSDVLNGGDGHDTFRFVFNDARQEAEGDVINGFVSGGSSGDTLVFQGYTNGALNNVGGDFWQLTYSDGVDGTETFQIVGVLAGGLAPGDVQFI